MKSVSKIYLAIILATATLISACGGNKEEKHDEKSHEHKTEETMASENTTGTSLKDDKLNAVYQQYLLLKDALVKADLVAAKEASMGIETGVKNMDNGTTLNDLAAKITAAADVDAQRNLFSDLSNEMIAKVKASGLSSGEVYVEYCPMVADNKGAFWLSNQKEIRNPYFGDAMMDCGSVKETLK